MVLIAILLIDLIEDTMGTVTDHGITDGGITPGGPGDGIDLGTTLLLTLEEV